jgi:large subunit ribosomal protein L24
MQRLRKGDEVIVVSGNDKGKRGRVLRVIAERNAVVIEGVRKVKRHVKSQPQRPGGIMEVEAPINASNVMPVDPQTGKPTRVRYKTEDGKKVRQAKSGATLVVQE